MTNIIKCPLTKKININENLHRNDKTHQQNARTASNQLNKELKLNLRGAKKKLVTRGNWRRQ